MSDPTPQEVSVFAEGTRLIETAQQSTIELVPPNGGPDAGVAATEPNPPVQRQQ